MSDSYLTLIPDDPSLIPDESRRTLARDLLSALAPDADSIEISISRNIEFFDCGEFFEKVECPTCHATIPMEWWLERMDEDFDGDGFQLESYSVPCCQARHSLNDLVYYHPQGFACFALTAINPNIAALSEDDREQLEVLPSTKLRLINRLI